MNKFTVAFCVAVCPALAVAQGAIQYQRGDDNQAELQQLGGIGNISQQYQDGTGNLSQITQTGDYNNAHVRQRSSFSEAQVTQYGHYNQLRIYQGASNWPFEGRSGSDWTAEVVQLGNANQVALQQDQGYGSVAYLHQEGNRNVHQVRQTGYPNSLETRSIGDDNRVTVNQRDGFATSRVAQLGNANQVSIDQWLFPYDGTVEVVQQGIANRADVIQRGSRRSVGDVVLKQDGSNNLMAVQQRDGHDRFQFTQAGSDNELDAWQAGVLLKVSGSSIGDGNRVAILQLYHFADLRVTQIGDDNLIDVSQNDLGWYQESASIEQIGNANQAMLSQATADFIDTSQVATIVQHGDGNVASVSQ